MQLRTTLPARLQPQPLLLLPSALAAAILPSLSTIKMARETCVLFCAVNLPKKQKKDCREREREHRWSRKGRQTITLVLLPMPLLNLFADMHHSLCVRACVRAWSGHGGEAYLAYDAWSNNHKVGIEQLTPNYLNSQGAAAATGPISPAGYEAPIVYGV